ncbi:Iojap protein [Salmonella enterica subsp. enterica serovar Hvittingfoss str. A4-620]|nr:Iojap protein [Salmonella enterica subsp. enterica serovar Hvittingfoss str. A4-620]
MQGKALQDFVIDKIDDLKGQDIIALDVQGKSSITDCMIICTGTSSRHVMSIADHVVQSSRAARPRGAVVQSSRAAGMLPLGVEGENAADWIVVDLGDVIVHVMQEESRRLYELEKLWS